MQSFRLAAILGWIAVSAIGASDPQLDRTLHDFAYAFGGNAVSAFEPVAHPSICVESDDRWLFVRSELVNPGCVVVSGYRARIDKLTDTTAQVLVDVDATTTVAASGIVVPLKTPWLLWLAYDRHGWNVTRAELLTRYLTNMFIESDAEWQKVRAYEADAPPADFAFQLANRASEWLPAWERSYLAIGYADAIGRDLRLPWIHAFCDAARSRLEWDRREFELAVQFGRKAVDEAHASGDPDTIAAALFIVAMSENASGHEDVGLAHLDEAAGMIGQLTNTRIALVSSVFKAEALSAMHNYREALTAAHRAVDLCTTYKWTGGRGAALKVLAGVHMALRHPALARDYDEQCVTFAREHPAAGLAEALAGLADQELASGETQRAMDHFREAIVVAEGLVPHVKVEVRAAYAQALLHQKQYAAAEIEIRRDIDLAQWSGELLVKRDLLTYLSRIRLVQHRDAEALRLAREALAQDGGKQFLPNPSTAWPARTALGLALRQLGRTAEAEASLRAALDDIDAERRNVAVNPLQSAIYLADKSEPYHALIDLLVAGRRPAEALAVAERMRGSQLVDAVDRQESNQALTPDERAREERLEARVAAVNKALIAARERSDARRERALHQELDDARLELDRFDDESGVVHAAERARHTAVLPFEPALPPRFHGVAVVQYVVTEDRTIVFTLRGRRVTAHALPLGHKALARRVDKLCAAIAARDLGYGARAAAMYRQLVAPVEAELRGAEAIAFMPDGDLWRVPFQALRRAGGRYVVERWGVFYAPSVTMLQQQPRDGGRPAAPRALLAFGNPTVGGVAAAEVRELDRNAVLAPLPQAEREVHSIATLYDPSRALVRTGAAATEGTFKKEASHYDVLHLATHGVFDDQSPMYSALVLAPADAAEDGLLETREILQLKLHARVAVLAACNTGRGEAEPGGGVIGLSWAFHVAGCPTTVVTQFAASDTASASLMIDFHRHLAAGEDCVKALRRAQLAMLRQEAYRHPFYWAAFAVVGRN